MEVKKASKVVLRYVKDLSVTLSKTTDAHGIAATLNFKKDTVEAVQFPSKIEFNLSKLSWPQWWNVRKRIQPCMAQYLLRPFVKGIDGASICDIKAIPAKNKTAFWVGIVVIPTSCRSQK